MAVARPKMPSSIKVGARTYDIEVVSDMDEPGLVGYTNHWKGKIQILEDLVEPVRRETLLHEVVHAGIGTFSSNHRNIANAARHPEDYDWEEHFTDIVGSSLLMILRDNPKLVAYLLHKES